MNLSTIQSSMTKKANLLWLKQLIGGAAAGSDAMHNGALLILGAAAAGGAGIGAFGAHITAHGKQDEDTVKKEYENERLKADVGYVASRLEDEFNRSKTAVKPKAARVLNV